MGNRPLVTVYITNFNYEKYIQTAIESVLAQSMKDFELFIIDDGSTDDSKAIIENYRGQDQISIIYQQNKGLNITNNVAMRAANGQYLMRLDADDFLEKTALEKMSLALEKDARLGLVFPDYYYVDADGNRTGLEQRHNFEKEVSLYDQPAHGACTMIRLEFLKSLGGYNESFTCQDGYDLWIKFITHHKVSNINEPLFSYRRHGQNLTTNEDKILKTRKQIKSVFVDENFKSPSTLGIIPVRNTFIDNINLPLFEIEGRSLLERKVQACLASNKLSHLVISSADEDILRHAVEKFNGNEKIIIIERPKAYADKNQSLNDTIQQSIDYEEHNGRNYDAVMTISIEFPFLEAETIDEAIDTLTLFKSDAVLSVRPDNRLYYQHTGKTLAPILEQEKFTKLEREALYKGVGGIVLSTIANFKRNKKMTSGRISHIVVDQKTAFGIFSKFDFELFRPLIRN
ncbi:glycosyltransferase [Marivirga harenae]|uniref:glycosyltransferase n=1 Tax=Marivirga harenae TaxID=2010992 RepID=UPI0026E0E83C|nr:glycosyltransferase [Marivirga harenae]WKV10960.1 glycosyltransferase [Marivirga harenae]|tara:strand:- start:17221 stop:18594 length:1374 start_codon:yes stop_codon:yes gene_type:complete